KLQAALHAKAKKGPTYRLYGLSEKGYPLDVLLHAYQCCRSNERSPGGDGQTFADVEAYGAVRRQGALASDLRGKTQRPQAGGRGQGGRPSRPRSQGLGPAQGAALSPLSSQQRLPRSTLCWKQPAHEERLAAHLATHADGLVGCCRGRAAEALGGLRGMMRRP